jgi:hypothetical protein
VRATTDIPVHEPLAKNYGPDYFYAGIQTTGVTAGYVAHDAEGRYTPPAVMLGNNQNFVTVKRAQSMAMTYRAMNVHVIEVDGNVFPANGSYTNYQARMRNSSSTSLDPDFRIVGHTENALYLDATSVDRLPDGIAQVQVLAKFFEVFTDDNEGLGQTYGPKPYYPIANVQIGFAFHKDPSQPALSGDNDDNRFPKNINQFEFDLESTAAAGKREALRKLHYPYTQVMVRFNLDYNYQNPDLPGENPVGPASSKPEVRFLVLPYVY